MIAAFLAAATPAEPTNAWQWLTDSSTREISHSIPHNLWLTIEHAGAGSLIAIAIAVPLALVLAHYGKAEILSSWIVNLGRVIPTIAVLGVFVVASLRNGYGFAPWPIIFALALLALPPVFANTYTAVRQVPVDAVSAARAMGLSERQIMTDVELPLALPLIMAGIRVAVTQVVATEALGALFGSEGLGIYISYGLSVSDLYQIQGGAILVAGTALAADIVLGVTARAFVPRGLRATRTTEAKPSRRRAPHTATPPQIRV